MDLALFIARRTARSDSGEKPGIMERIAVISVALSIAVMLLAIAVMSGFKREIGRKMSALSGNALLTDVRNLQTGDAVPVRRTPRIEEMMRTTEGFASAAPYALKGGIIRTGEAVEGVMLKGVGADYGLQEFGRWIVEGELPRIGGSVRTKDLLISRTLARRLKLASGDKVEMLFVGRGEEARRDRFKVSGIYASGMDEMDAALLLTDIGNVQRLSGWQADEVSGYEIVTTTPSAAGAFADTLEERLCSDDSEASRNLAAASIESLYPNIFDWLKAHDVNAVVILVIMLVVAFFNMASALLILVLEQTRTIGLLKSFGMQNGPLRRIFLYRAAFVALRGAAWGNLFGLGLCLLQHTTHLLKLDPEGYLLSEVPVALSFWGWIALNAGFLAAIVALLLLPASIVARIKPEESIRYE